MQEGQRGGVGVGEGGCFCNLITQSCVVWLQAADGASPNPTQPNPTPAPPLVLLVKVVLCQWWCGVPWNPGGP
jgi:hypothetical protein